MGYHRLLSFFVLGVFLLAIGVTGATASDSVVGGSSQKEIQGSGEVLRFGIHTSKIGNFDPDFAKGSEDATFADLVFNSLLRYVPGDSSQLEPDIALKIPEFEIQNNRQIWTIELRKGIFFHDSPYSRAYELTTEDVVYSLQKAADPERSAYSGQYDGMAFEVVDAHTLRIVLEKPMSPLFFLPRIANRKGGFILSKRAIEMSGYETYMQHPVGTGPFRFDHYTAEEKLVLSANEIYFRGRPKLLGVEIH
ncbi:MAG: hypothetical protein FP812_03160, partial [Desulfobacula sp.]|nr:hypothetical protein [Desulfobacula sp.]